MEKPYRDPAWLERKLKRKSVRQIAFECGVSVHVVYSRIRAFKLTLPSERVGRPYRNRAWLEEKGKQGMTPGDIASLCKVYLSTILVWMHRFGLPTPRPKKPWHCSFSPEMAELFDGLLLGGGALSVGDGGDSASFRASSETREYLEWVRARLESFRISQIRIKVIGRRVKKQTLYTGEYHELLLVRNRWYRKGDRWYRKGEKAVPLDFELTPNIALCWFLRGGHLEIYKGKRRKAIRMWVDRYSPAGKKRLITELVKIGIHPSLYVMKRGTMVRIPTAESELFLNYVSECPDELKETFGYKWEIIRRR